MRGARQAVSSRGMTLRRRSNLLLIVAALSLLAPVSSGAVAGLPDTVPSSAWERSFPLQAIVRASDSQSGDQFGQSVAVSGNVAIIGALGEGGGIGDPTPDAGAAYVLMRRLGGPNAWSQARKLLAPDAQARDELGFSVALSGKNVVVGASQEDGGPGDPAVNAGAAYVFYVSLLEAFKGN